MTMVYLYYSDRYVSLIFQENKVFEFPSVYDQIYISDFSDDVIFCVQFANSFVLSLVSKRYQTISICTMMLESVCKIYPRCWHLNAIPIQHNVPVYIWANYSISSLFIPIIIIVWNVLIWLKYDFIHIFIHSSFLVLLHNNVLHHYEIPEVEFGGQYGYLRANNQHWLLVIIGHAKTNILQQNTVKPVLRGHHWDQEKVAL